MNRMTLRYNGGYPTVSKHFNAIIKRENDEFIFINQFNNKEQFRIDKKDIINIEYRTGNLGKYSNDLIVMKVNYSGSPIELLLRGGFNPSNDYSKLMSLVYDGNIKASPFQELLSRHTKLAYFLGCFAILIVIIFLASLVSPNKNKPVSQNDSKQEVTQNASKNNQSESKPQPEKSEQTETQKKNTYYSSIRQYGSILQTDIKNINEATPNPNQDNLEKIKEFSQFVVEDCNSIKKLSVPESCKDEADKVNRACDIYIDIYTNFPSNFQSDEWLSNNLPKLEKAKQLIQAAADESNE